MTFRKWLKQFEHDNTPFGDLARDAEYEFAAYVEYVKARKPNVTSIIVTNAGNDEVDVHWTSREQPFERIRRITGYLVGTVDRWNDAKQAEEKDRIKHDPKI